MAKDLTPAQVALRKKARGLAEAAGKTWANLSREQRHTILRQARTVRPEDLSQSHSQMATADRAVQEKARAAAAMAGKVWASLSREERQNYLAQARKQNE